MSKLKQKTTPLYWLVLIQLVLAYEWLQSGIGKFTKPDFMKGIAKTLQGFAGKTPHKWYGDWLKSSDPELFGNITRFSEVLIGSGLAVGGIALLRLAKPPRLLMIIMTVALFGGALLNLNFYWAAGWSSPSTKGINVVMGLIQFLLGLHYVFWLRNRTNK